MTVKLLLLVQVCFLVCHWLVTHEPWSDKERQLLQEAVRQFIGESRSSLKSFQYLPWTTVSNYVGTRSWSQCRLKWSVGMCGRLFTLSYSTLNAEAGFTTVAVSLTSWHHVLFFAFPRVSAMEAVCFQVVWPAICPWSIVHTLTRISHHASGHCWKHFQGQRSWVKVICQSKCCNGGNMHVSSPASRFICYNPYLCAGVGSRK